MKKLLLIGALLLPSFFSVHAQSKDVLVLDWLDLIPQNERQLFEAQNINSPNHEGNVEASQSKVGGVRRELNGSTIKIPGFVVPLEGDSETVSEFLLVPYFGACIHVPPPPPNQIIYVKYPKGAPIQELWDVVFVTGKLKTQSFTHPLGETAYSLEGISIEEYYDEEMEEEEEEE